MKPWTLLHADLLGEQMDIWHKVWMISAVGVPDQVLKCDISIRRVLMAMKPLEWWKEGTSYAQTSPRYIVRRKYEDYCPKTALWMNHDPVHRLPI